MGELVLCAECNRHVRGGECPFCGAHLGDARSSALARASRAAIFAIAATPVLAACHSAQVSVYGGPPAPISAEPPEAAAPASVSAPAASDSAPAPSASAAPTTAPTQAHVTPTAETAHVTAYGGPPRPVAPPVPVAPKP